MARNEIEATLVSLPPALGTKARALPVALERFPNAQLEADGIALDTLGLFVGEAFPDGDGSGAAGVPAHIILFLENIWLDSEDEEGIYRDEVRTTFLHELGHYLGLSEDDLEDRGLL